MYVFSSLVLIEEKSTFNAMQSNWNNLIAYGRKVVFTVRWGLFVERASIWAHFHYVQKAQKQTNIKQWTCTLKPRRCAKNKPNLKLIKLFKKNKKNVHKAFLYSYHTLGANKFKKKTNKQNNNWAQLFIRMRKVFRTLKLQEMHIPFSNSTNRTFMK